ncbi:MAG: MarC family protein [Candidatus Nezhaarchaeales archaeon]
MIDDIVRAFISLFVIMNPFASIPIFLAVAKEKDVNKATTQAVSVAAAVLFTFLFFGPLVLAAFGITLNSLKVAGGLVLGILGIQLVLGQKLFEKDKKYPPALTLIGTPMLTGPGVITMTMILTKEYGYIVTTCAAVASLTLSWLVLRASGFIERAVGGNVIDIVSRVMGLLVTATAVELVVGGITAMLKGV